MGPELLLVEHYVYQDVPATLCIMVRVGLQISNHNCYVNSTGEKGEGRFDNGCSIVGDVL